MNIDLRDVMLLLGEKDLIIFQQAQEITRLKEQLASPAVKMREFPKEAIRNIEEGGEDVRTRDQGPA